MKSKINGSDEMYIASEAVFYPETLHVFNDDKRKFDNADDSIVGKDDCIHFESGKNSFITKFSRAKENNELFSNENGIYYHSGDCGIGVANGINSVLLSHNLEDFSCWESLPCNYVGRCYYQEDEISGIYQVSDTLPAGEYKFSVYVKIINVFKGDKNPGVFIRVTNVLGDILAESERLTSSNQEYLKLTIPFEILSDQSVMMHIITNGKGAVYLDAAMLDS